MEQPYFRNTPNNSIPEDDTVSILENNDATVFHTSLTQYTPTPLEELSHLSKKYNIGQIYIKDESYRFGLNAFKVLGASYAMHQSLEKNPDIKIFCTATDGNHGKAVAWSARYFNKKSIVFVPKETTIIRINAIEKEGATVVQINGNYDEACQIAKHKSEANNWTLIQDTAWDGYLETPALIMSGYLTLFKELEHEIHGALKPNIDIVFLQAGVGSMAAAGIYYYLNTHGVNRPKIVIVETEVADSILLSLKHHKIITSQRNGSTIMAGLHCETPSLGAWNLLKNGTDYAIKISDDYAKLAMRELYVPLENDKQIISGESGAAGLAGFLTIMIEDEFKDVKAALGIGTNTNILCINTEGDTDEAVFNAIINNEL